MKGFAFILCCGVLSAASVTSPSSPAYDREVREVQAAFDKYIDGWKNADVEALSKVYAADARVTGIWPDPTLKYPVQGWPEVRKELERVFDFAKGMSMYYTPRHVEIYGDVAIISTNWEWTDLNLPKPGPDADKAARTLYERRQLMLQEGWSAGQATFIFVHRGSRWVLVHEHASVLPMDRDIKSN